jgi:hypothetical protein
MPGPCDDGTNSIIAEGPSLPRVIFEYALPHDEGAPTCVSLLQGKLFDWRRAITQYTALDASHLQDPKSSSVPPSPTVFTLKAGMESIRVEVVIAHRDNVVVETIVEIGNGCKD